MKSWKRKIWLSLVTSWSIQEVCRFIKDTEPTCWKSLWSI